MTRVGIGGWTFPPWRGAFYPEGLPQAQELAHAASVLTSIEINATFHGTQKPDSFRRWRDCVPENFVFSLKAPRYATYRRELAEAGPSITRFLESGITELGEKLGPLLWQFPPTRRFEADSFAAFLALLPDRHDGMALRHALEVHHDSFAAPAFAAMLRKRGVAWALVDDDDVPVADTETAPFVYLRLKRNSATEPAGYAAAALDGFAARLDGWMRGGRDCFCYFISGDKVFAPTAARAMLDRLAGGRATDREAAPADGSAHRRRRAPADRNQ